MLQLVDLHVKYGQIEVLHGIQITVNPGEIVTILGANGAGKSTTLLTISSLVKPSKGAVMLEGAPLHKLPPHEVVRRGVAHVPEGRRIFGTLTVQENLNLGAFTRNDTARIHQTLDWIYELFPILAERRRQLAGTLSGGEQQMLAIARGLMSQPRILLLDEPSLGLAPLLVKTIFQTIRNINASGVTIVLVEQNARAALKLAHRGYVLEVGRIVLEDSAQGLLANPDVQKAYLGGA
ncbi:ABC transporter ATP-binding protein [Desulfosoma caldarium]|uniref:Amino acid/amide ABC transporter ATP-binding protein 2 (HAAT family) n=1 Tax=Desulfosoma caldarium TaxID=610254 RepID=A0A3N1UMW0_9BACT|nr:ABC transporter ATP-binding protein [Desulfosoma caldarium]ROQ89787.1 amino acid/amide ABC transporter ATP-binding protein 2 (HAAT family) [Desulfosoma caldarium]